MQDLEIAPSWIERLNGRVAGEDADGTRERATKGPAEETRRVILVRDPDRLDNAEWPAGAGLRPSSAAGQTRRPSNAASEVVAANKGRTDALARELEAARREADAAKEEMTRVSLAFQDAWEQERKKAAALATDLALARKQIKSLEQRPARGSQGWRKHLGRKRAPLRSSGKRSLSVTLWMRTLCWFVTCRRWTGC